AWMWLRQAIAASARLNAAGAADIAFYQGKLQACQYFYRYELNKIPERLSLLASSDDTCLAMQDEWF
ncbi:MAG TPA: acyl-CoA dehydrogenase, partial [Gammaproteobacteria bacterium]|nr:acyl-CoA dehydrogenase [Gammaproteobacteria bacterium]